MATDLAYDYRANLGARERLAETFQELSDRPLGGPLGTAKNVAGKVAGATTVAAPSAAVTLAVGYLGNALMGPTPEWADTFANWWRGPEDPTEDDFWFPGWLFGPPYGIMYGATQAERLMDMGAKYGRGAVQAVKEIGDCVILDLTDKLPEDGVRYSTIPIVRCAQDLLSPGRTDRTDYRFDTDERGTYVIIDDHKNVPKHDFVGPWFEEASLDPKTGRMKADPREMKNALHGSRREDVKPLTVRDGQYETFRGDWVLRVNPKFQPESRGTTLDRRYALDLKSNVERGNIATLSDGFMYSGGKATDHPVPLQHGDAVELIHINGTGGVDSYPMMIKGDLIAPEMAGAYRHSAPTPGGRYLFDQSRQVVFMDEPGLRSVA